MEYHLELYKRVTAYLAANNVPLPVEMTKPELQEELRVFANNALALDVRALCDPEGKLKDMPYPYLTKLLSSMLQMVEKTEEQALKEADSSVRVERGVGVVVSNEEIIG
jgi:hypothetical protein